MSQKELHHLEELLPVLLQNLLTVAISPVDDLPDLPIQEARHLLRVGLGLFVVPANEHLFVAAVGNGTDFFAHAVFGHHIPGHLGDVTDILGSAC